MAPLTNLSDFTTDQECTGGDWARLSVEHIEEFEKSVTHSTPHHAHGAMTLLPFHRDLKRIDTQYDDFRERIAILNEAFTRLHVSGITYICVSQYRNVLYRAESYDSNWNHFRSRF